MHDICAGGHAGGDEFQRHGADGGDELQLPGAGDGCGAESRAVFEHGERDDTSAPRYGGADGAKQSRSDGDLAEPNQSDVDGGDG